MKFTNYIYISLDFVALQTISLLVRGTLLRSHSRCCGKKISNYTYICNRRYSNCTYDNRGTRAGVDVTDFALDRNAKKKSRSVIGNFMRKLFR